MELVQDNVILQVITKFNPWWLDEKYVTHYSFRRISFNEIHGWFSKPNFKRAIIISGARRVGKTVLLHQFAEQLLKDGWNKKEILYLSLDHPVLKLVSLDRIIDVYRQNIMPQPRNIVLLLDEVQHAKDWGTWIKLSVDFTPGVRIVATGSAALGLQEEGTESGTGRWVTIKVPTLSFYEYLTMLRIDIPDLPDNFRVLNLDKIQNVERTAILNAALSIKDYFHKYLLIGGFPELASMDNVDDAQRLLREDVVDKVLKRDMTTSFGVRNVGEIERLFIYLCIHSGEIFEKKTIASNLGVSVPTVDRFLNHLESANLIYRLLPIHQTGKLALKGSPKIHISDMAIKNAVLLKNEDILIDAVEMGLSVESAVYKHFYTFYYSEQPVMGYWRETGGKEVDLIIKAGNWTIPVEVKYREDISIGKKDGLWVYAEASKAKTAILVSKNAKDFDIIAGPGGSKILIIPAFLLLFLLGHSERSLWRN